MHAPHHDRSGIFFRTWVALKRGVIMADTCPGRDRTAPTRNQKGSMGREETAPQTRMQRSHKGTQPRDPRSVVLGVVLDRQEGWHHFQIWARNSRRTHRPGGMRGGGKGGWRSRAAFPSGQFLVSLSRWIFSVRTFHLLYTVYKTSESPLCREHQDEESSSITGTGGGPGHP